MMVLANLSVIVKKLTEHGNAASIGRVAVISNATRRINGP